VRLDRSCSGLGRGRQTLGLILHDHSCCGSKKAPQTICETDSGNAAMFYMPNNIVAARV
jgi:hypothetical protein